MTRTTRAISYGADLPIPPDEAFAFVSDPATWPRFFESVESATADEEWGHVGGGYLVTRFLGRVVTSQMVLTDWDPPHAFRYTARQNGRPDLDNRRVFEVSSGGTRLRGTTEPSLDERHWRSGPVPGVSLIAVSTHVLRRVYNRAMAQLPDVIESGARHERVRLPRVFCDGVRICTHAADGVD